MKKPKKQLDFFKPKKRTHGGSEAKGKRKSRRPLDTRKPIHVVLRSTKAKGKMALIKYDGSIRRMLRKFSYKFDVTIYEQNINFNHIHILIRGKTRKGIQDFLRTIASLIARLVTGATRAKPFGKFWDELAFTRLLSSWGREFEKTKAYILQNTLETLGLVKYKSRIRRWETSGWQNETG